MRRSLTLGLLLALTAPLSAQHLARLERVHAGATILVQTPGAGGYPIFDRCKLLSADSSALTCVDVESTGGRLVYPIRQLDSVYEIHKSHAGLIAGCLAAAGIIALIIGSAVTGNLSLDILAFILLGLTLSIAFGPPSPGPYARPYPRPYAAPGIPWNHGETGRLVYLRSVPIP